MSAPRYGDNIFAIGAVVSRTLRLADWPRDKIDGIMAEISTAPNYDAAIGVCSRYISIEGADVIARVLAKKKEDGDE